MLGNQEFQQFVTAPADARYEYFIHEVTKSEEVWIVLDQSDNIMMAEDAENTIMIPVWPFKEYAQCCLEQDMDSCKITPISLDKFMNDMLLGMKRKGIVSSVCWNGLDTAIIEVDQLLFDLNWELAKQRRVH